MPHPELRRHCQRAVQSLQAQLHARKNELNKLEGLDGRIDGEIAAIRERLQRCARRRPRLMPAGAVSNRETTPHPPPCRRLRLEAETECFKDVDGLKQEHNDLMNVSGRCGNPRRLRADMAGCAIPIPTARLARLLVAARRAANAFAAQRERGVLVEGGSPPLRHLEAH